MRIRKSKKGKDTDYALYLVMLDLQKLSKTDAGQIAILNNSIKNKWTGVFPVKEDFVSKRKKQGSWQD